MARPHDPALCPRFHMAAELIGRRWTGAVLYLLLQEPRRFSDLRDGVPGLTDPMLSARLHELESEGVIERSVLPGSPVRVRYALTAKGRALGDVMTAIGEWGRRWVSAQSPGAKARPGPAARRPRARGPAAARPRLTRAG